MIETLPIKVQLTTLNRLTFLLNALYFDFDFKKKGERIYLVMVFTFLTITISSNHINAILEMVSLLRQDFFGINYQLKS